MIRRQEKYSTRAGVMNGNSSSVTSPETPQHSHGAQHLSQKASMGMSMDSVVTGVSKLNVFSSSSTKATAGDVAAAGVYNMFCCSVPEQYENDDGDTSTCLETVASSRQSSPVAPTATSTRNNMNFDLASRAMVQFPSLQSAFATFSSTSSQRESNVPQQQQQQNNFNPARSSPKNTKDKEEDEDDDPPLSSQTEYARQQLYQSHRYRDQRIAEARRRGCTTTDEDCYCVDEDDDDELLLVDEVEISRGLGGYEEGFGIHDYYHVELPSTIVEEDEEEEESFSVASKSRSVGETEEETLTAKEQGTLVDNRGGQEAEESINTATVCLYCQNGTCDNEDCSHNRFLI